MTTIMKISTEIVGKSNQKFEIYHTSSYMWILKVYSTLQLYMNSVTHFPSFTTWILLGTFLHCQLLSHSLFSTTDNPFKNSHPRHNDEPRLPCLHLGRERPFPRQLYKSFPSMTQNWSWKKSHEKKNISNTVKKKKSQGFTWNWNWLNIMRHNSNNVTGFITINEICFN